MKKNNIPLKLDERIYDIEDIKTVITADEKDVGKMGYFANSIHLFKNLEGLDGIKYGKLIYLSNLDYGGDKSDKCFVCSNQWAYRYFIPKDSLKPIEKKHRPFTNEEFLKLFDLGKFHSIRIKGNPLERLVITCIYTEENFLYAKLNSSDTGYGPLYFFTDCEYFDGEWKPFGVLVEDEL